MPLPPKSEAKTVAERVRKTAQSLLDREKKLALRAKEKHLLRVYVKLLDYERVLKVAEKAEEEVSTVVRAALLRGLEHYEQWAKDATEMAQGQWREKQEPSGRVVQPIARVFTPPPVSGPQAFSTIGHVPNVAETQVVRSAESVWADKGRALPFMPSGGSKTAETTAPETVDPSEALRQLVGAGGEDGEC